MYWIEYNLSLIVASDSDSDDALHIGSNNDDDTLKEPLQKKRKVESSGLYNDFSARMMVRSSVSSLLMENHNDLSLITCIYE